MTATELVSVHGNELSVRIAGSGPAIVLVHGIAGTSATWKPVIDQLAENHTVIAPDLPGHGRSDKPRGDYSLGSFASTLRDLLVTLGHEDATVVGHSLGGGIAMQFAYQFPARCERLVLVSSGGLGDEVSWMLRALTAPGVEYLLPAATTSSIRTAARAIGPLLGWVLGSREATREILRGYDSLSNDAARSAFMHTIRGVVDLRGQRISATERFEHVDKTPTLIVWGQRDSIIPVNHAHRAHDLLTHSQLEIFESCGHFPQCEEPERLATVLEQFTGAAPRVAQLV